MSDREQAAGDRLSARQLLDRIEALLQEAYGLPRDSAGWARREEIEWEMLNLCRAYADLHAGPPPYWAAASDPEGGPPEQPPRP